MTSHEFQPHFLIGDRAIGRGEPVLIIAEAGVAHFGSMDLACQLVDLAAEGGADVFKTQLFDVENLISREAQEWRKRLGSRNLTLAQFHELKERCDRAGLIFMATAHDSSRISWLEDLKVPAIKIGSGERNNLGFFSELAALGKPMIISTGMYGNKDISELLQTLRSARAEKVALLHCVTSYPTPINDVNLGAMDSMRENFPGPIGYSDHTEDHLAVLSAVARGASIVERHITILRDVPNAQDWRVSSGPEDFSELVRNIRRTEVLLGHGRKELAPCEEASQAWALKSVVAAKNLSKGMTIAAGDLVTKRPGLGIPANQVDDLTGRRMARDVSADSMLSLEDLV